METFLGSSEFSASSRHQSFRRRHESFILSVHVFMRVVKIAVQIPVMVDAVGGRLCRWSLLREIVSDFQADSVPASTHSLLLASFFHFLKKSTSLSAALRYPAQELTH